MTYITINSSSLINSANALSNLLKDQPMDCPIYWDSFLGTPFTPKNYLYQYTTSIPVTTPLPSSSYYDNWDYCIDVSAMDTSDFASYQTYNLGKARGTTSNITINNTNPTFATTWTVRAYYQIESYPVGGTFYKSQYSPPASFILDNLII